MDRVKELVLKRIKDELHEHILRGVVNIDIKHGIVISVHRDYAREIEEILERLLQTQVIYAYHRMHYYASDIIKFKCVYTI